MADNENIIHTEFGAIDSDDVTTGGAGSGASRTDTGGLDADGNELGATSPSTGKGRTEADRMDDAEHNAGSG